MTRTKEDDKRKMTGEIGKGLFSSFQLLHQLHISPGSLRVQTVKYLGGREEVR